MQYRPPNAYQEFSSTNHFGLMHGLVYINKTCLLSGACIQSSINTTVLLQYDVREAGKPGGGGEYEVQLGFGWTNGVVLQLIEKYADKLHFPLTDTTPETPTPMLSLEALYLIIFGTALAVIVIVAIVWNFPRCSSIVSPPYRCLRWLAALVCLTSAATSKPHMLQKRLSKCV